MNTRDQITGLHDVYTRETGLGLFLTPARERAWFDWLKFKFTEEDLKLVIAHIKRGIREQRRQPGALKFRNLIEMPDYFEEDLAEARAKGREHGARSKEQAPKAKALASVGRPPPVVDAAKPAGTVLESPAFKAFCGLKGKL